MSASFRNFFFVIFIVSGFCGLLYQIVWMRLALTFFGVITPVASVVVSAFMLGLALGNWAGGKWIRKISNLMGCSAILLYLIAELIIGIGAFVVPSLFELGYSILLTVEEMSSYKYLFFSSIIITISIIPWCFCMGATIPVAMFFFKQANKTEKTSFSFLYLANVIGAMLGALISSFILFELIGFSNTLKVAGTLNFLIALSCFPFLKKASRLEVPQSETGEQNSIIALSVENRNAWFCGAILFFNGFASMAFEIIWTRAFIPTLGNFVYAFAGLLTVYLLATWVGSLIYRKLSILSKKPTLTGLIAFLTASAFIPIIAGDPQFLEPITQNGNLIGLKVFITLFSIFPFCLALGCLTPMIIDEYSTGQSKPAGLMNALNIIGSILGPLFAAYILLPLFGSRESIILIIILYFILFIFCAFRTSEKTALRETLAATVIFLMVISFGIFKSKSYEEGATRGEVKIRRDHTATVISYNLGPYNKGLLVNGQEMTMGFNQAHKIMAHFPLATLQHKPKSAVVIAFGMGTTYRSLLSWDIKATAVELVPSVIEAFGDYHADAQEILKNPRGRIIIDDGRRFLNRTEESFDLITVDPPPPIEAAGTALLYSEDFYEIVKKRLKPNGIFFHWFPGSLKSFQPVIRSIQNSFPHVKVFQFYPGFGFHIFCSLTPIKIPSVSEFSSRLSEKANNDFMEFFIKTQKKPLNLNKQVIADKRLGLIKAILSNKLNIEDIINDKENTRITDDRPYNEYFLLRKYFNF